MNPVCLPAAQTSWLSCLRQRRQPWRVFLAAGLCVVYGLFVLFAVLCATTASVSSTAHVATHHHASPHHTTPETHHPTSDTQHSPSLPDVCTCVLAALMPTLLSGPRMLIGVLPAGETPRHFPTRASPLSILAHTCIRAPPACSLPMNLA